jgi:predicted dehydrogenase
MWNSPDRRRFLGHFSAGILASAAARRARASTVVGANRKLAVGLIGCGGRGVHDAGLFRDSPDVEVAYVCDVDDERRRAAAESLTVDASHAVSDMRRILDDPAVDAVIVATPDHWHSPAAILACDAGKHVYVEKPISHNIRESRLLVEAARRNGVCVQHGTQCRSTSTVIEAVKRLREGVIGDVLVAKCWNVQRRSSIGRGEFADPPAGLDYDTWVGPAPMIPYRTNRVHNRWTPWYHFGAGDMGNDGVHDIDYARWGLGVYEHPVKVVAIGGKLRFDDDSEFPDTQQVTFEFAGAGRPQDRRVLIYEQRLWSTSYPHNCDSGAEFYGTTGQMFLSRRGKLEIRGEDNSPIKTDVELRPQDDAAHVRNFCDAVREGAPLNADALTGHLSTSLCHLGNIATRVGRALAFDRAQERIIGDEEAQALVSRQYRDHWGTPAGA